MHIGAVGFRGFPDVMGGIERHCEELYPRIKRADPNCQMVCAVRRPYVAQNTPYVVDGIRIVPLPSTRKSSIEAILNTGLAVGYFGLIRRPDILHIHGIGPAIFTVAARLLGLRVVVTHHGKDYRRGKWNKFAKAVLVRGERVAMKYANKIVAVSESLALELKRDFPKSAEKVVYIPNGVPDIVGSRADDTEILARHRLHANAYIVSVGRLVPEKGFEDLIAGHHRSGTSLPLVIVGGADHDTDFVRSLRAKASDKVIFTGALPHADVLSLCGNAACFVLASHHEGLPIAALEAAAAGAPLILSDIEANVDLKLPPKNYFPVSDVNALARKLSCEFSGLDENNAEVIARFDWNEIARQTICLYSDLLSQKYFTNEAANAK